jgi:hypothetical protein
MKESSHLYIKEIHDDQGDQTGRAIDPLNRLNQH